mmetsp:Transcript_26250/g.75752  ORF Transcript_26250/g.75752 Transcript_26250/m.75752 type:complete len:81 (+) Transcript_26250:2-244(+)
MLGYEDPGGSHGYDLERSSSLFNPELCVLSGAEHCSQAIGFDVEGLKQYNRRVPCVPPSSHFVALCRNADAGRRALRNDP